VATTGLYTFTEEITDRIIAVLKGEDGILHTGGLPSNFFYDDEDNTEAVLKTLQPGDLSDYPNVSSLKNICPAILVRGMGPIPGPDNEFGLGGMNALEEVFRIIHIRTFEQCYNDDGEIEKNIMRARNRYARLIENAIFNDRKKLLALINAAGTRTEIILTSGFDAAGSQVYNVIFQGWDFGYPLGPNSTEEIAGIRRLSENIMAQALDISVKIRSGGVS